MTETTTTTTEHEPLPQDGDYFALQSTCILCDQRLLWRLGTAEWEHAPPT
jgi:hypothetical protein